ncbi:MAG TPA: DegT/DnrJ/EryC1/StrS family aminotransferase [Candidatus Marinimicrobia bacterium]|nr:DegT/DnrJ/EryC1/StrS family aminotransferase [Candidatus Neomarinimicrobiota bacterium]
MIPFMDLETQYLNIREEIDSAIFNVIHGYKFINGPEVATFEKNFATAQNLKYMLGLASGTAALHLAYEILGITSGDEVIVPAMTFIATAETVRQVGAKPVFADIDPVSYNIDCNSLEKLITPKTKAIVVVHLHGNPCEMDRIVSFARKYNLKIIEDCAQAHLAEFQGQKVGTFGDVAAFSFYPGKNLGAYGDAGALGTNDETLYEKAKLLANHGRKEKYIHQTEGYNYRLDTLQAAILDVKLRHLPEWTEQRINIAKTYHSLLKNLPITLPEMNPAKKHVYHIFAIATDRRQKIIEALKANQIAFGIHYPLPLHLQPAYSYLHYKPGDLPYSELLSTQFLSLPMYAELSRDAIEKICQVIASVY